MDCITDAQLLHSAQNVGQIPKATKFVHEMF